jgi:hypothetical protein
LVGTLPFLSPMRARRRGARRHLPRLERIPGLLDQLLSRSGRRNAATCADEFLTRHVERRLRPSTQREYRRILNGSDTRAWRERPISQIGKRDVLDVIDAMDGRGSPGPHPEVKRDRVLSDEELRYLPCALETERSVFGPSSVF